MLTCGSSTKDFFLCTLCAVDIATAWVELEASGARATSAWGGGVHRVRHRLPMPLLGLDSDDGSEFINQNLYDYCHQGGTTFSRSRAWKKNDSAHVEQKNGAVVRHLIGYDRVASPAAYAQLRRVYRLARLHVNFFQPVQKLVSKHRDGARVRRVYDRAQTPFQFLREGQRQKIGTARRFGPGNRQTAQRAIRFRGRPPKTRRSAL